MRYRLERVRYFERIRPKLILKIYISFPEKKSKPWAKFMKPGSLACELEAPPETRPFEQRLD